MTCYRDDLLTALRCHIADPDDEIWSDCSFDLYFQTAFAELAGVAPDAFAVEEEICLKKGQCRYTVDCLCVTELTTINGKDCTPIEQNNKRLVDANAYLDKCFPDPCDGLFKGSPKAQLDSYNPSYTIDNKNKTLVLSDAPPCDVKATVCCVPEWQLSCDGRMPDALCGPMQPGLIQLVLHYAYAADHQSLTNIKLAEMHFDHYQTWLNNYLLLQFSKDQPDYHMGRRVTAQ